MYWYLIVSDACRVQISTDFEKISTSKAPTIAAIYFKTIENANKIFRKAMEKSKHENYVSNLPKSQTSSY